MEVNLKRVRIKGQSSVLLLSMNDEAVAERAVNVRVELKLDVCTGTAADESFCAPERAKAVVRIAIHACIEDRERPFSSVPLDAPAPRCHQSCYHPAP